MLKRDVRRMEIRAGHHPERLKRYAHRQFHDVGPIRKSMQHGIESVGHLGVADCQIDRQRRTVHVRVSGDVMQRISDCLGTAGRDGNRTENVRVLSACEPECEVGRLQFIRAESEQRGQGTERQEVVVRADDGRIDAHTVEEFVRISAEFGDQLGQSRQRRGTDQICHVSKCK